MAEIHLRASSIASAFDCWLRWEATHLNGKRMPSTPAATIGTAVHAGAAAFDQARMDGSSMSADDAAGAVVDALCNPTQDVDWAGESKKEAEATALTLYSLYCAEIAPKLEFEAVELKLQDLPVRMGDGLTVILTGTLDRVYKTKTGRGINDIKTGKVAVGSDGKAKVAGHGAQLGAYEVLYSHATGLPISEPGIITGLKTSGKPAAGIGAISNASAILLGEDGDPGLLDYAGHVFKTGLFPPNPRSMLCGKKYCPIYPCKYVERGS